MNILREERTVFTIKTMPQKGEHYLEENDLRQDPYLDFNVKMGRIKELREQRWHINTRRTPVEDVCDHGEKWEEKQNWSEVPENSNFVRVDIRRGGITPVENVKVAQLSDSISAAYLDNPARSGAFTYRGHMIDSDIGYGSDPVIIFPRIDLVNTEFSLPEDATFRFQPGIPCPWRVIDPSVDYPEGRDCYMYSGHTPEEAYQSWLESKKPKTP